MSELQIVLVPVHDVRYLADPHVNRSVFANVSRSGVNTGFTRMARVITSQIYSEYVRLNRI